MISSAATLSKRPSTTNDSSRNEAISRRRCVTTSCRHGNGFNTAGFTPPPTSRPASSAGHVTKAVTVCASGLWRDGDPPGHGLQVLLPVDGNTDSLSTGRFGSYSPPPHHHSDSIHLQTYRGQPSNGLLVATADVSVRLKDNFLFVTEDFLLLRWSSAQLSYGAATTHEINYNFIWWTQGWFGLAGAGWMGGDRCGRRLIPTVPASSPAWKPQTSNSG